MLHVSLVFPSVSCADISRSLACCELSLFEGLFNPVSHQLYVRLFLFEACLFCFVRGWERTEEEPPQSEEEPPALQSLLFLCSRLCGSDDDGSVVTWEGSAVPDEFSLCCRYEDGSVVTGEGPEVPDEFLLCCSVGNGSVVTWKGSEVPDEFLFCCREEDGSVVTWEGSEAPVDVLLLQC